MSNITNKIYQKVSTDNIKSIYKKVKAKHYILDCKNKEQIKFIHKRAVMDLNNSHAEYFPFEQNSPNFRKSNFQHKDSIVNGYFEQYNYFPWNKDSNFIFKGLNRHLSLFFEIANLYCLEKTGYSYSHQTGLSYKNLFNEKYFIRICYQLFPKTKGYLSLHRDPSGMHQLSAPIISLSKIKKNGLYYILNDKKVNVQSLISYGDTLFVDQSRLHAVEHDLFNESGTEHFLISVHKYHSDNNFLNSSTNK